MGPNVQSEGSARSWRAWLRKLAHDLGADEWEEAGADAADPGQDGLHPGAQASLDEVLRDAAEARDPSDDRDGRAGGAA
jgi:hypothetical protein